MAVLRDGGTKTEAREEERIMNNVGHRKVKRSRGWEGA